MQEIPVPGISHNEVLIKILKTAICGTGVHIYNWDQWSQKNIPVPVGHEFVGKVVAVGSHVNDCRPGDLVSGEGHIICGHCKTCRCQKYCGHGY
ncbi:alcohol dehydrogenase catalytic domain-containing protein [Desulfobacter hydrogenophilus]|uniref:alcohol dehydrogenase catalytic domain-containing protein n=1 Tax=Desulfobacter hydrogenophilus TaxID=2291 RepID=UPI0024163AB9|nr:alcohol dehydrogenase catalytic domain-containing protein [Desulfobacter hydrogenophilus]